MKKVQYQSETTLFTWWHFRFDIVCFVLETHHIFHSQKKKRHNMISIIIIHCFTIYCVNSSKSHKYYSVLVALYVCMYLVCSCMYVYVLVCVYVSCLLVTVLTSLMTKHTDLIIQCWFHYYYLKILQQYYVNTTLIYTRIEWNFSLK